MARTKIVVQYDCEFEQVQNTINNILSSNGFREITINTGENVWKKGTGMLTAMQFSQKEFVIYAWVQMGLGDLGGSEMDLTGFVAAIPKKQLINIIEQIKKAFC